MTATAHIGLNRDQSATTLLKAGEIVVTSYHTLQRDIDFISEVKWKLLILDESQALKNPISKSHKAVNSLEREMAIALSGTPVENNIGELWSIMRILNPGLLGSRASFIRSFRKPIADGETGAIDKLRRITYPFMLRRTKEQVAPELPRKEEISIPVTLSDPEYDFYFKLREEMREEVRILLASDEPFRAATAILTALSKLRQAAVAPGLVGGPNRSTKLDTITEKIKEGTAEGHKILVFSQYVRVLKLLEKRLGSLGMDHLYLDGSVPSIKRKKIIDRFQSDSGVLTFLISLKAGGIGINLTGADYVFLVVPWWNPAIENQAIDRTHRIGQTKPVFAYRFLSEGTVEEQILELQDSKRELVQNIIGVDSSIFKKLTSDQILSLFQ